MNKIFIGGEFHYSPFILLRKKCFDIEEYLKKKYPNKYYFFTSGGLSSLDIILKELNIINGKKVLLPSYLCPSIIIPFKKNGIKYSFYKINKKLEIETDDLLQKSDNSVAAILLINYFGFRCNIKESLLTLLRNKNIIIIEDAVQSFFSDFKPIGDYVFNSFRKFSPVNGSVIIANKKINIPLKNSVNQYQIYKTLGLWLKWLKEVIDIHFDKIYLSLFRFADKKYNSVSPGKFTLFNKHLLTRYNFKHIMYQRKYNYEFLLSEFKETAIYKYLPMGIVPLGFPILLKNRDEIRAKLLNKNIFCPIHWNLSSDIDKVEFSDSWNLSKQILTIPISENVTITELKYFQNTWKQINNSIK